MASGKKPFKCLVVHGEGSLQAIPSDLFSGSGITQNTHGCLFLAREPPGCSHGAFRSVFGVARGRGVPHSDGGGEDALYGGSVELGVYPLGGGCSSSGGRTASAVLCW